jgi:hypothetical protein
MKKRKLSLIILLFFSFNFFLLPINKVLADDDSDGVSFVPQVTIPGSIFQKDSPTEIEESTRTMGVYIKAIYNYLLLIVGIVAAIVLMTGGILWLTAGGNTERIGQAQKLITGSLTGLVLMLVSYILLVTINPNLVDFKIAEIKKLDTMGDEGVCLKDRGFVEILPYIKDEDGNLLNPEDESIIDGEICSDNEFCIRKINPNPIDAQDVPEEYICSSGGCCHGTVGTGTETIDSVAFVFDKSHCMEGTGKFNDGFGWKPAHDNYISHTPGYAFPMEWKFHQHVYKGNVTSQGGINRVCWGNQRITKHQSKEIDTETSPTPTTEDSDSDEVVFTPQVTIDEKFKKGVGTPIEESTQTIAEYIKSIYQYMLAVVGLLAAVVLMLSGVIWLTAGGNTEKIGQAKGLMTGSLAGLVLMLTSYIILQTVNPNLVEFKVTPVFPIIEMKAGCCQYELSDGTTTSKMLTSIDCYNRALESRTNLKEVSSKELEESYEGDMAKYLHEKGIFFENKMAENKNTCFTPVYCHVNIGYSSLIGGTENRSNEAVLLTKSGFCGYGPISGGAAFSGDGGFFHSTAYRSNEITEYKDEEELKEAGLSHLLNICSRRADGDRCEGTNSLGIQCWCYDGFPWFGDGGIYQPCGRKGSICYHSGEGEDRDWSLYRNTRNCGTGLRCYEEKSLNIEY